MTTALPSSVIDKAVAYSSLEWKLTDPMAFGLTTASPLQRAICRIADGVPLGDLAAEPTVTEALGGTEAILKLPFERPTEMAIIAGIRTAKSLTAACGGFHMAMTCDVSMLRPGEIPRVSVVSTQIDNADVIMDHLVGTIEAKPLLRRFMVGKPTAGSVFFRQPTGTIVEVRVVAGARAGSTLVSRWSAGVIFDEFPRMIGGDDGVVNWDDMREAVVHRLLYGSQIWNIGSPWAPFGPAYVMVTTHWGHPTSKLVIVKASAPAMNPVTWTPERCAAAKAANLDAYRTDVLAEFASPEEALFSSSLVDRCTRKAPLVIPPKPGNAYYAAMDPATRGNGWTLSIATREPAERDAKGLIMRPARTVIVRTEEWVGSREDHLDAGVVLSEAAGILAAYGVTTVDSDQAMGDALVTLGRQVGLNIVQWRFTDRERTERYLAIRTRMDSNEVELPPIPRMRTDLLHLQKRVTPGGMHVHLPKTSDGRHCDHAPTLMLVLSRVLPEPTPPKVLNEDPETARVREMVLARWRKKETW